LPGDMFTTVLFFTFLCVVSSQRQKCYDQSQLYFPNPSTDPTRDVNCEQLEIWCPVDANGDGIKDEFPDCDSNGGLYPPDVVFPLVYDLSYSLGVATGCLDYTLPACILGGVPIQMKFIRGSVVRTLYHYIWFDTTSNCLTPSDAVFSYDCDTCITNSVAQVQAILHCSAFNALPSLMLFVLAFLKFLL